MLAKVGIDFFQDLLTLEPGQRWERQLYREIDRCDLFLLFWSSAAKRSTWVLKEVHHAMMRNGGDGLAPPEILPVIIEGPPPVDPPPELAHLHFNDQHDLLHAALTHKLLRLPAATPATGGGAAEGGLHPVAHPGRRVDHRTTSRS